MHVRKLIALNGVKLDLNGTWNGILFVLVTSLNFALEVMMAAEESDVAGVKDGI
jgi:hypothetical protein